MQIKDKLEIKNHARHTIIGIKIQDFNDFKCIFVTLKYSIPIQYRDAEL